MAGSKQALVMTCCDCGRPRERVRSPRCDACRLEHQRALGRAKDRRRYANNPERRRYVIERERAKRRSGEAARQERERYARDPSLRARKKAWALAWAKANPVAHRLIGLRQRAREQGCRVERVTAADILRMLAAQEERCHAPGCDADLRVAYHVDHVVPLCAGGSHAVGNLQLLCPDCNLSKRQRSQEAFAQERRGA